MTYGHCKLHFTLGNFSYDTTYYIRVTKVVKFQDKILTLDLTNPLANEGIYQWVSFTSKFCTAHQELKKNYFQLGPRVLKNDYFCLLLHQSDELEVFLGR